MFYNYKHLTYLRLWRLLYHTTPLVVFFKQKQSKTFRPTDVSGGGSAVGREFGDSFDL